MKKLMITTAALGLLAASSIAGACTLSAWSSQSGTAPVVGGPGDPVVLARYSGICAMQADSGTQYVQDNSPSQEGTLIARFYFLAAGSGSADVFVAYSDEAATTPVFTVSADSGNVTVTPANGTAATASLTPGRWNSAEVNWTAGGAVNLWVNSDATSAPADGTGSDGSTSVIEAVRLGAVNGLGGFSAINFDQYESRRTTMIGREIVADANGDGQGPNIFDAIGVIQEIVNGTAQPGQPDCNEDGSINIFDAICVVQIIVN